MDDEQDYCEDIDTPASARPPSLRPLGDRILIRPIAAPTETESGLHLVRGWEPEQMGDVVAVGHMTHPLQDVASSLAHKLFCYHLGEDDDHLLHDAATLLEDLTRRAPLVKAGDRVLFSVMSGQELTVDDQRYLLMREADLLAVLE